MFTQPPSRNYWLTVLLMFSLFLSGLLPYTRAAAADRKRKPVVVSFGQPNIWSLEQAHYLLARLHMTNLDLQAKALTDDDLDPNRITGTRIQIIKQLLEIGAQFDQGVGFQNQRIVENARFNDERRRNLITSRDQHNAESLQIERDKNKLISERETITDPDSERAKELDAQIKRLTNDQKAIDKQASAEDTEIKTLSEPNGSIASPSPTSAPFDAARLPKGLLEDLTKDQLKKLANQDKDPRLNATTMLDNSVQMQYEIIAKQLTLLRDEVGPGERLVFLELPQSVYTTPGPGDEKMAQAWWHVNGYTRTDPLVRLLLDMYEVEMKWSRIQNVPAYRTRKEQLDDIRCPARLSEFPEKMRSDHIFGVFAGLKCERENARNALLDKLYREANSLFARVEQGGARDTSEMVEAIRKLIQVSQATREVERQGPKKIEKDGHSTNTDLLVKPMGAEDLTSAADSSRREENRRTQIQQLKLDLLNVLSNNEPLTDSSAETLRKINMESGNEFERGMEFIRLDDELVRAAGDNDIKRRTVRTVDIIPRQSSLNVNDIQSTVKATGILAAFKFLFGFAGQVNFQRQKEQFEQYVHQEMYASGFGKGNRDFGWTFGALPGTNRVAPGVRTTYAALVVPEDAESIILSARGCYFPRKNYQPLDFEDTGHSDWKDRNKFSSYNCGDDQTYIVPVPDGGKANSFWVTNIDYEDGKNGSEFTTVSVRGNNFSAQMGVLINGVPLAPTVGLAQPNLMPKKLGADNKPVVQPANNCVSDSTICGNYERIDAEQIVFSFKMPANYVGTPTITLIGPGKSVDLNSLKNIRIRGRTNDTLDGSAAFMYGRRPEIQLLNFTPGAARVKAILTGSGFAANNALFINGTEITGDQKQFRSAILYSFEFDLNADDMVKLTLVRDTDIVTTSIPNPAALTITDAKSDYVPPANNQPGLLTVTLKGSGFAPNLDLRVTGAQQPPQLMYVSTKEVRVLITRPTAPSSTAPVGITLTNNATHGRASKDITSVP
jgi:hypothetical protein